MGVCFQVKEENIEFKEAKENFHAISAIHTEIDIKEEPLEKDNFLEKTANDTGKSFSEALIFASFNPQIVHGITMKTTRTEHGPNMFCPCSALVFSMVTPLTIFCHIVG